jgi:hypothetical protein
MRALVLSVLLLSAVVAAAQTPEGYTSLLLPVRANNVRGANGSIWVTEWMMHNAGVAQVYVAGPFPYLYLSPIVTDNEVKAGETKRLFLADPPPGMDGAFVGVPTTALDALTMSLRVRDISVHAQSYGTNIPIVPVSTFKSFVRLIDVPTDPAYRATLRIYSAGVLPQSVRVTVYAENRPQPIEQYDAFLAENGNAGLADPVEGPAYLQLDPLSAAVRAAGPKVRIEISNLSEIVSPPPPPIWAFVSISHNVTQQVTLIVP